MYKTYVVVTVGAWVFSVETLMWVFMRMVSEFLIGRLVNSLFPEAGGEIAVGLGDGIKGGLGEVSQGGIAAPG